MEVSVTRQMELIESMLLNLASEKLGVEEWHGEEGHGSGLLPDKLA